jgi:hypothetical protein
MQAAEMGFTISVNTGSTATQSYASKGLRDITSRYILLQQKTTIAVIQG